MTKPSFRLFFLVALLLAPQIARAQPPQPDDPAALERAKASFAEGVRLYDAKSYEAALEKFRAAYRDRPSPGIKRNIALCLRALGRTAEAVTTLDEMLAESKDSRDPIKPEVRAAAEQAIAEMSTQIASARMQIVVRASLVSAQRPIVTVTVDGAPVTRFEEPLRLMPGEHRFVARAPGFIEATETIDVKAGDRDVPVRLELAASDSYGRVVVRASRADAQITVDGALAPTQGGWAGFLPAGKHVIQVDSTGAPPVVRAIDVVANRTDQILIDVDPTREKPPEYQAPPALPPKPPPKQWYVVGGGQVQFQRLTVNGGSGAMQNILGEAQPTKRTYGGLGVVLRAGRAISATFSLELHFELGSMSSKGPSLASSSIDSSISITNWVIGPAARFRTPGKVRFYTLAALGLEGHTVKASFAQANGTNVTTATQSSSNAQPMGLVELGLQTGLGINQVVVDLGAFADVHGIDKYVDDKGNRMFLDSPAARYGLRITFGLEF
jgi:hypothetical protein